MSHIRKILLRINPELSALEIAKRLVKMCEENKELCEKYVK